MSRIEVSRSVALALAGLISLTACPAGATAPAGSTPKLHDHAAALGRTLSFGLPGWRRVSDPSGTITYFCDNPRCSPDAKVSYVTAADRPRSLAAFRVLQIETLVKLRRSVKGFKGKLVDYRVTEAGGFTVYEAVRTQTVDGKVGTSIGGLVLGSREAVSLISSAPERKEAQANFVQFLPIAMLVAGTGGKNE